MKLDGDAAAIGITDYAQEQLGDIVYVDLPEPGATITQFEKMGEIESVKAVSDLFAPGLRRSARGNAAARREAGAGEQRPARRRLAARRCA